MLFEFKIDVINYRFLTTETNLKASYIFRYLFTTSSVKLFVVNVYTILNTGPKYPNMMSNSDLILPNRKIGFFQAIKSDIVLMPGKGSVISC